MRRMMAVQPAATIAGPSPKGMIRAPLPASDQPLPEIVERLSRVVSTQSATPASAPTRATLAAKRSSWRCRSLVGAAISKSHPTDGGWVRSQKGLGASYIYVVGDLPSPGGHVVLLPAGFYSGMPELERSPSLHKVHHGRTRRLPVSTSLRRVLRRLPRLRA